jgi:small redox-active disulfide protein 2
MVIKVLGSGCKSCLYLEQTVREVVERLGIDAEVVKVTDLADIMGYGIMTTPALVVDEQVKSAGRMLKPEEVERILTNA